MSSRIEDYLPDPPHSWERKNYQPLPETMKSEERAEKETDRDLNKSIEQLLCDFHDMAERGSPGREMGGYPVQAMLHAQKRMVGMMAKVALSNAAAQAANDKLQGRLYYLNVVVTFLTVFGLFFGAIQAAGVVFPCWFK
jgi:hypothetical protein